MHEGDVFASLHDSLVTLSPFSILVRCVFSSCQQFVEIFLFFHCQHKWCYKFNNLTSTLCSHKCGCMLHSLRFSWTNIVSFAPKIISSTFSHNVFVMHHIQCVVDQQTLGNKQVCMR
jgi:hypothetical protein